MNRDIEAILQTWANDPDRKPLIIRGARQVGKSWSVQQLGKSFKKIHTINLEQRPDWHGIFDLNLDAVRILRELEVLTGATITPGEDLLFFDEIQAQPKTIQALRYFYEQLPSLHVISAGSLLEFVLNEIPFPVGRVQMVDMYPMSFGEYLLAIGEKGIYEIISAKPGLVSEPIHEKLLLELRQYFAIGGMPACVSLFAEKGSLISVREIQHDLLTTYRQDFLKYTPHVNTHCLQDVFSATAQSIGQQISYTKLSATFTGPTNKKAFDLLTTARVVHKIAAVSPLALPLSGHKNSKKFKAIFLDIGLLTALNGIDTSYTGDYHALFRGAMAEQFVGQELITSRSREVFYWARQSSGSLAEIDFVTSNQNRIIPVEVKSGAAGKLKSLHILLNENPHIHRGYVLSEANYGEMPEQKLTFLPIYYAGSLGKDF